MIQGSEKGSYIRSVLIKRTLNLHLWPGPDTYSEQRSWSVVEEHAHMPFLPSTHVRLAHGCRPHIEVGFPLPFKRYTIAQFRPSPCTQLHGAPTPHAVCKHSGGDTIGSLTIAFIGKGSSKCVNLGGEGWQVPILRLSSCHHPTGLEATGGRFSLGKMVQGGKSQNLSFPVPCDLMCLLEGGKGHIRMTDHRTLRSGAITGTVNI